jgi:hypothetical protein
VVAPITAVNGTLSSYFVGNPQVLSPPKVLALPRERIERALCNTGVAAQDVRALFSSDDWCALQSRNEQLLFFYEFAKTEYSRSLTSEVLGQAFGIEPSHVRKIRLKAEKKLKPPYRPAALNEDQTAAVAGFIEKRPAHTELRYPERRSQFYRDKLPEISDLSMDGFVLEETCESDLSIGRSSPREREIRSPS